MNLIEHSIKNLFSLVAALIISTAALTACGQQSPAIEVATVKIVVTESGFSPASITIAKNTKVEFANEGTEEHWPASSIHPTHQIYPEFDSRQPIAAKNSWSFTFDKEGIWRFHDHLYPEFTGVITVRACAHTFLQMVGQECV